MKYAGWLIALGMGVAAVVMAQGARSEKDALAAENALLRERQEKISLRLVEVEARLSARVSDAEAALASQKSEVDALLDWHMRYGRTAARSDDVWQKLARRGANRRPAASGRSESVSEAVRRQLAEAGIETDKEDTEALLKLLRMALIGF